ncbi:hypothetical protein HGRIS_001937 [Hohenbuehelia grisea]|uniref:Peptidase M43 pregnancy-associated plasma-A domain-containing protein n=1 Tax=Hohenbuehelia grisea TaxID=104357 RepID=A0ABR3JK87_9AGAR
MILYLFFAHIASSYLALANPVAILSASQCGTHISTEKMIAAEKHFATNKVSFDGLRTTASAVNVYFHTIEKDSKREGYVSDAVVNKQIQALNEHYAGSGMRFVLKNTTRTISADWFSSAFPKSNGQAAMKKHLRQGGASDLNIYTVGFENAENPDLLGYATFPSDVKSDLEDDGVVVHYSSLPGGSKKGYNEGKILTHEVGHWAGLLHTFQGGCEGEGDGVADTPAQASATKGCPEKRDSCPDQPGLDPINNFMDYSNTE